MSSWPIVLWANVLWAHVHLGKCLYGQKVVWANVTMGKRRMSKCLRADVAWANVIEPLYTCQPHYSPHTCSLVNQ
jgi:hypothetical protein